MTLIGQITLGFFWTCVTISLSVIFMVVLIEAVQYSVPRLQRLNDMARSALIMCVGLIWMMVGTVSIVFVWALLFLWIGAFDTMEESFYFAIVSITTVGFGDVILETPWRILSGFAAAVGFMIFGLNTAAFFEMLTELRRDIKKVNKATSR
ncbi:MAG: ion channel [Pseudomonadota bacterium]